MSVDGKERALDQTRDVLINVNALGRPVPSARFMGGREHDLALDGHYDAPTEGELAEVLASGVKLMPAVMPTAGPFRGRTAYWNGDEPAKGTGRRSAAVALYLANVTACCLDLIGHRGEIVVEGPFARNTTYLRMLRAITGSEVIAMKSATGTSQGAALLVGDAKTPKAPLQSEHDDLAPAMSAYHDAWRKALG